MRTSTSGVDLITQFEGFPNGGRPYNDPVGLATVGYGHLIARRPVISADLRERWLPDQARPGVLTPKEAARLLGRDLSPREQAVASLVRVPLTQGQFDAIVSLVFNIGEANFAGSTVLRRLNAGDYRGAADAFLMWNKAGSPPRPIAGLTRRRETERARFLAASADTRDPFESYTSTEVAWIREYDKLRRKGRDPARRRELRRLMTEQRKRIWQKAQDVEHGGDGLGWDHRARRARYASLLARTRTKAAR